MCHFISGFISNDFELDNLNNIGINFGITFKMCENQYVKNQIDKKEIYLIKNTNCCDCGTELGIFSRTEKFDKENIDKKEIDKLKKKGWSDFKIKRYIDEKNKTIEKNEKIYENYKKQNHVDVENWYNFICELFLKTNIKSFGLLLHWYKGGLLNERINISEKIKLNINELNSELLLKIKEDTIYYIEK